VTGGNACSESRRSDKYCVTAPNAAFSGRQWGAGAGSVSVYPAPKMPLGGTPTRTRNARLPTSIARVRPALHSVSRWPHRASRRMSAGSSGHDHNDGFQAKR
jgi:hypothetical protein